MRTQNTELMLSATWTHVFLKTQGDSFIDVRAVCGRGRGNRKAGGSLALYLILFLSV